MKVVLRGKFIALSTYIKNKNNNKIQPKLERSHIIDISLMTHLETIETIEKQEEIVSKTVDEEDGKK